MKHAKLNPFELVQGESLVGYVKPKYSNAPESRGGYKLHSHPEFECLSEDKTQMKVCHKWYYMVPFAGDYKEVPAPEDVKPVFENILLSEFSEEFSGYPIYSFSKRIEGNKYDYVLQKLEDEGIHYALTNYSDFSEVENYHLLELIDKYKSIIKEMFCYLEHNSARLAANLEENGKDPHSWKVVNK